MSRLADDFYHSDLAPSRELTQPDSPSFSAETLDLVSRRDCCDGENEKCPPWVPLFVFLSLPVGGAVWGGLRDADLMEDRCHGESGSFDVSKATCHLEFVLSFALPSWAITLWDCKTKWTPSFFCCLSHSVLPQQQQSNTKLISIKFNSMDMYLFWSALLSVGSHGYYVLMGRGHI